MYKKMYLLLFNAITDALEEIESEKIKAILKQAQIDAEEICISSNDKIQIVFVFLFKKQKTMYPSSQESNTAFVSLFSISK